MFGSLFSGHLLVSIFALLRAWCETLGHITEARCRCGYSTLCRLGGTRRETVEEGTFPHHCSVCGIVNAPMFSDGLSCPECQSAELTRYGSTTVRKRGRFLGFRAAWRDTRVTTWNEKVTVPHGEPIHQCWEFYLTEGDHLCPSCGVMSLRFSERVLQFFD